MGIIDSIALLYNNGKLNMVPTTKPPPPPLVFQGTDIQILTTTHVSQEVVFCFSNVTGTFTVISKILVVELYIQLVG